ncbi:lipase [Perilla frutescens var. hirtella]|nr:lipase [Perilla frutescens var. hirtella]
MSAKKEAKLMDIHIILQVSSSAQYIIHHFTAATGCRKPDGAVKNMYATGKVKGCFVIWQMLPNKWLFELVVAGHKVAAGSDGNVAWRHTPWLGAHAAKGGVRPLRRALQASHHPFLFLIFVDGRGSGV